MNFYDIYNLNSYDNDYFKPRDEVFIYGTANNNKYLVTKKNGIEKLIPKKLENKLTQNLLNWKKDKDGNWILVDSITSALQYGWINIDNETYYLDELGKMQIGWQYLGESWYYFADNGYMQTGWQYLGGNWYYFADNGYMQTGWQYLGENWYYFADNGYMQTGWQYLGENWYYFADNGYMQTGWQYLGENWYYFDDNGYMLIDTIIQGVIIGSDGKAII